MLKNLDRTRHLRKAEAAQLKKEALQTAPKKKEETVGSKDAEVVSTVETNSDRQSISGNSNSSGTSSVPSAEVAAVKKKQYSVNILSELDTNVEQKPNIVPVDPVEFAKQERLRKQREMQVIYIKQYQSHRIRILLKCLNISGEVSTGDREEEKQCERVCSEYSLQRE